MISKLKNKISVEENKRLISNFFSLLFLQGANYLLPLLTLPYLVRVLGVEYFGLLAFATIFIAYFSILTDYGFNLTAIKDISIHRENKDKIIEIFSAVMSIKIILMFISFCIMSGIVFIFDKFSKDWIVYFLTFGSVIAQVFFPIWFFQGMEKMKYITYLNILSRTIFTIAIFIFVQNKSDYYLVPFLSSLGAIVASVLSLLLIFRNYSIIFKFQKVQILKIYLLKSWHIFISNVAISLYTISVTFILGLLTNNIVVGYYAAADKIIQVFNGLMTPISQTIYPHIVKKVNVSKMDGLKFIKFILKMITIFTGMISIFIFFGASFFVDILLGEQYNESVIILQIMSIVPFLVALSNIFGIQTMVIFGREKAFSKILMMGSIFNLVLSFILVLKYEAIGSAISVVTVEMFITIAMFIYIQNNGLKLIGENKNV